jgi:hypothetical protein
MFAYTAKFDATGLKYQLPVVRTKKVLTATICCPSSPLIRVRTGTSTPFAGKPGMSFSKFSFLVEKNPYYINKA